MANYYSMKHNDEAHYYDGLDRQSSRQTQLPSAFESYPPADTLFQGRMHTFIPPDDSFRTEVSPRMEYIIPPDTFIGDTLFRGTGIFKWFTHKIL